MAAVVTGASLSRIYDRLNAAPEYNPMTAETFADWSLEAGDIVTMKRGEDEYEVPVHSSRLVWRGAPQMSLSATGTREREPLAKVSRQKYGRGGGAKRNDQDILVYYHTIEETESYWRVVYGDALSQLEATIIVTASSIRQYVDDNANSLHGEIQVTASSIRSYVDDTANSLHGEIVVTSSSIRQYVDDTSNSLHGEIVVTSSSIRQYVDDTSNNLHSEILVTASSIRQEVSDGDNSLRGSITVQKDRIDLIVEGTGNNQHIKPAQIQAGINAATGTSKINLTADHVVIDGDMIVGLLEGKQIGADSFMGETLQVIRGGQLLLGEDSTIGSADSADLIVNASVSDNVLTLTKYDGSTVTFSKATSLSGTWSGRNYKVTASPQGNIKVGTVYDTIVPVEGSIVVDGTTVKKDFIVYSEDENGDADTQILRQQLSINAQEVYEAGQDSVNVVAGEWTTKDVGESGQASVTFSPSAGNGSSLTLRVGLYKGSGVPTNGQQTISIGAITAGVSSIQLVKSMLFSMTKSAWSGNTATMTMDADGTTQCTLGITGPPVTLTGSWSGRTYTVTPSPSGSAKSDTVYVYPKSNAGGDMSILNVYAAHTSATDANILSDTREQFFLEEDVSSKRVNLKKDSTSGSVYAYISTSDTYSAGSSAGYASAHVTGSWSDNAFTYSKTTSGSTNSATVYVGCTIGQLQGYTGYFAYANTWTTGSASPITSTRKQLTITDNGNNAVKLQSGGTDTGLTYTHGKYNAGWAAAYGKVSVPTSTNTGGSISIGVPPSTVDGPTATYTYSVSADNNYAYIKYGSTTVARTSNSAYSNGWAAAYGKVSVPTSTNTGGSISIGVPPSTVDGTTDTYIYSLSTDSSYAYLKYGTTTVARVTNTGGGSHSITITPDTVGKSTDPGSTYTQLWSTTNFVLNRWYVMTVNCGTASKKYKILVATSGK